MERFLHTMRLIPIIGLFIISNLIHSIDNPHFFRTNNFFPIYDEPRLAKSGLTSIDVYGLHGSTSCTRTESPKNINNCCLETNLLNIVGLYNMHALGEGVPGKDPTNPADLALINLEAVPGGGTFGQLLFTGKFSVSEIDVFITQNISCGFFLQAHIPARKLKIDCIRFFDESPIDSHCPNIDTPEWQTFLNLFNTILAQYDISINNFSTHGIGDVSFLAGYTYHHEDTDIFDFFDFTIRIGILVPTGKKKDPNIAFSIANGYDGHIGVPMNFTFAFGACEWITLGAQVYGIVFANKTKELRMKTSCNQNGFITLTKGLASVNKGTIIGLHAYAKADHVICGFSALLGYSYAREDDDVVSPCDTAVFDKDIVNCDELFKSWRDHTLHFLVEYDFAKEESCVGFHVGAFFNLQIGGSRVFKTNTGGGNFGVDLNWTFD